MAFPSDDTTETPGGSGDIRWILRRIHAESTIQAKCWLTVIEAGNANYRPNLPPSTTSLAGGAVIVAWTL